MGFCTVMSVRFGITCCISFSISLLVEFKTRVRAVSHMSELTNRQDLSILQGVFLVVQLVKNLPVRQETQVQSPSWEDALVKGMMEMMIEVMDDRNNG